jgi:hypothetical protein
MRGYGSLPRFFVLAHHWVPQTDVFRFRRFRLNLISFLRLPLGVSEHELRDVLKECSASLCAAYLARAERSSQEWPVHSGDRLPDSPHPVNERPAGAHGTAGEENFDFHDTATLVR